LFGDQVAPSVPQAQQVAQVVVVPARTSLLSKLVKDHICCANHRVLLLEVFNALELVCVLLDHPVGVVLEHHSLLVIEGALDDTANFVHSLDVSRNV
jgi:hypothetical protein